jgi:hypothetical protein
LPEHQLQLDSLFFLKIDPLAQKLQVVPLGSQEFVVPSRDEVAGDFDDRLLARSASALFASLGPFLRFSTTVLKTLFGLPKNEADRVCVGCGPPCDRTAPACSAGRRA